MKSKILSLIGAMLLFSQMAYADICSDALVRGKVASSAGAVIFCSTFLGAIVSSLLPATDNAIDLGSASKQFRSLYIGTSVVNAGTSQLAGLIIPTTAEEAVAGAGTTVTDAAALSVSKHLHQITGANGTVGWKFTTGLPVGSMEIFLNTTAGVPLIYGESGSTCNGGGANAACTLVTGIAPHICWKSAALTYICS